MKNTLAVILTFFLLSLNAKAQNVEGFRALEIRYGRTGTPGDLFTLLHERYLSEKLNLVIAGSAEFSRKNLINYHCYSLDALAMYYSNLGFRTNGDFEFKAGVGVSMNYSTEPNLYKNLSVTQKINYGLAFTAVGEWAFTDDLSLTGSITQRLYKKKALGMFAYDFDIGLKWKIW